MKEVKMIKYYLVEEMANGEYKEIDSSFSLATIKNRKDLQKKVYDRDLKVISLEK